LKDIRQKWPNCLAVYILLEVCWSMGLIICAAYAGNLISFLTLNFKPDNIETVRQFTELTSRNEVVPIMLENSMYRKIFMVNNLNVFESIDNERSYF